VCVIAGFAVVVGLIGVPGAFVPAATALLLLVVVVAGLSRRLEGRH